MSRDRSSLRLDHVIYAVGDLAAAADRLATDHGLLSVPGGRHPAWGTENRIVPMGGEYVELVAVADPAVAAGSGFGRAVEAAAAEGDRLAGWAVATDDLDRLARRLGLDISHGSRTRPDGATLGWRFAGVERALETGALPFFIQWEGEPALHPGLGPAGHQGRPHHVVWLEVSAPAGTLEDWLGEHDLPLRVTAGEPSLAAAGISTGRDEIVLR